MKCLEAEAMMSEIPENLDAQHTQNTPTHKNRYFCIQQ
jgi:hypothetical protein